MARQKKKANKQPARKTKRPMPKLSDAQQAVLGKLLAAGDAGVRRTEWPERVPTRSLAVLKEVGCAKRRGIRGDREPIWLGTQRGAKVHEAWQAAKG